MRLRLLTIMVLACGTTMSLHAQDANAAVDKITSFPDKFFAKVNSKTSGLDKQLTRQTEKYLNKLARREAKLKRRLYKYDSAAAKKLFPDDPTAPYRSLSQKIKKDTSTQAKPVTGEYLPNVDSLQGTLSFLNQNPQLLNTSKVLPADIQNSVNQLRQLQSKMLDADQAKQYIQARKEMIKQYLLQYAHLPAGITNAYNDYNKQLYYYSQQVREYKEMLNDPDKMMTTALKFLNKLPAFATFMKNNSFLAGLFNIPADYGTAQGLEGLQTRDQVMGMIQNQIASGRPNASSMIQQNLQDAHGQLDKLKDKLSQLGGGSSDIDIPAFKPNTQKTKTFFQRLEYGTNMQTTHSNYFFPVTTDLSLSVGYKLNNKNTIGVGASYKMGWGSNYSHINISSQGTGIRSFLDMQIKKSFFASGGFEYNYQQPFTSFTQVNNLSSWQQSGLIGISKILSMNSKLFKKTKMQLLWDFLSYQQVPRTQPLKFRVGYNF